MLYPIFGSIAIVPFKSINIVWPFPAPEEQHGKDTRPQHKGKSTLANKKTAQQRVIRARSTSRQLANRTVNE